MGSSYAPLHLHSNRSLLDGASTIDEYVEAAAGMGLGAIALTDTNALYGAVPFYRAARAAGIRPIIGACIEADGQGSVFLAKNEAGYRNLCRLITARQLDDAFSLADAAEKYSEGLVALSADTAFLARAAGRLELYAELPATLGKRALRGIFKTARELEIPLVATPDAHFATPERHRIQKVLSAVRENALVENLPRTAFAPPGAYLKTPAEMEDFFRRVPEALSNTIEIAEACEFEFTFGEYHFPHTDVPEGETPFSHLSKLAFEGAKRRYRPLTPTVIKRLAYELDVIEKLNFPEYFLIVEDIVRHAREEGIAVAGRGSAADSLVAYCLGITIVDPIAHDLYFERFLNLSRTDCPDIDIDICWRRRDELIDYAYKRYGRANVAMISTHVTYQVRSAFRDVARVFGVPVGEINALSKRLPQYGGGDIAAAAISAPEAADFPLEVEPFRTIVEIASQIVDYPRHLGVHVGGLVISDRPLTSYLPLEMAAKGIVVSQYDMGPVEDLGLVKMDLLGQRALTVVNETVEEIKRVCGETIDPYRLPDPDRKTGLLVRRGQTIGGFQVESPGMRNLLQMMRAHDKSDLLIGLSLIRPGPAGSGMKEHYVRRRLGLEKPFYLHPSMEESLKDTYGVMLYQEDILKVARAVAGFDLAVGDELRKAISKGRSHEAMAALKKRFVKGAAGRGVEPEAALAIWEMTQNFAAYSYCKAHATTYAEISWATVWLKAHYPAQFLAARISNMAGFYHPRVYLEDARRLGVRILPLDVNESAREFTTGLNSIRPGFMAVKNLSRKAIDRIVDRRAQQPFRSLADFLQRIDVPKREVEALIKAGAFSSLARTRPEALLELDAFSNGGAAALKRAAAARLPEYSLVEIVAHEDEAMEMTPTAHPMVPFRKAARSRGAVPGRVLRRFAGKSVTLAGFIVTRRRAPTRKGEMMAFATFEDETDIFEVTLFPDAYRRYGGLFRSAGPFLVKGRVESQHGACTVTAGYIDYLMPSQRRHLSPPATANNSDYETAETFDPESTVPTLFGTQAAS